MMLLASRYLAEPDPEAEIGPSRTFHKKTVYCFLSVCVGYTLRLLDAAEFDGYQRKAETLNGICDSLESSFVVFERDGISAENLQVMQTHDNLRETDTNFNAFDLLSVAPEDGFSHLRDEPEVESFIVPDSPGHLRVENMAEPFQPRSPEHMALWMVERLTERLGRAMRRGLCSKVQRYVSLREVMVRIRCFCVERSDQRGQVWAMMQSLTDLSNSDEDE